MPDCPTINYQLVNNPVTGNCDFLGYYCQYGNFIEGCKQCLLEDCNNLFILLFLEHYFKANSSSMKTLNSTAINQSTYLTRDRF